MFRNSAKLRLAEGVLRPKPGKGAPPPPGVDIIDDGSGVDLGGGVVGAYTRGLDELGCAGDGEVARYIKRLASSSPFISLRDEALKALFRSRAERATAGGGVRGARGGEDRICEFRTWKEVIGRSSSSSSDRSEGEGLSGTVEVSETKDRLGAWVRPKCACRPWYTGEDSGSLWVLFHDVALVVDVLTFTRAWLLEAGYLYEAACLGRLLWLELLPERRTLSENIGAASGEESRVAWG